MAYHQNGAGNRWWRHWRREGVYPWGIHDGVCVLVSAWIAAVCSTNGEESISCTALRTAWWSDTKFSTRNSTASTLSLSEWTMSILSNSSLLEQDDLERATFTDTVKTSLTTRSTTGHCFTSMAADVLVYKNQSQPVWDSPWVLHYELTININMFGPLVELPWFLRWLCATKERHIWKTNKNNSCGLSNFGNILVLDKNNHVCELIKQSFVAWTKFGIKRVTSELKKTYEVWSCSFNPTVSFKFDSDSVFCFCTIGMCSSSNEIYY